MSPQPDIWGILSQTEEEAVLARIYEDKLFLALLRKYAEGANKAMVIAVKNQNEKQALRLNAQFFCYSSMIIKARRAFRKFEQSRTKI